MCSIVVSQKQLLFQELIKLNQRRGSFSFSYTSPVVDDDGGIKPVKVHRDWGEFDPRVIDTNGYLHVGHTQAPTGGLVQDETRIHPAYQDGAYLFHNGILKPEYVKYLQARYKTDEKWDTKLLLTRLIDVGVGCLSEVDGSFACLFFIHDKMLVFRNEIAPLFVSREGDISSTKFDGGMPLRPNEIFKYSFKQDCFIQTGRRFVTKNNPYDM